MHYLKACSISYKKNGQIITLLQIKDILRRFQEHYPKNQYSQNRPSIIVKRKYWANVTSLKRFRFSDGGIARILAFYQSLIMQLNQGGKIMVHRFLG